MTKFVKATVSGQLGNYSAFSPRVDFPNMDQEQRQTDRPACSGNAQAGGETNSENCVGERETDRQTERQKDRERERASCGAMLFQAGRTAGTSAPGLFRAGLQGEVPARGTRKPRGAGGSVNPKGPKDLSVCLGLEVPSWGSGD